MEAAEIALVLTVLGAGRTSQQAGRPTKAPRPVRNRTDARRVRRPRAILRLIGARP